MPSLARYLQMSSVKCEFDANDIRQGLYNALISRKQYYEQSDNHKAIVVKCARKVYDAIIDTISQLDEFKRPSWGGSAKINAAILFASEQLIDFMETQPEYAEFDMDNMSADIFGQVYDLIQRTKES